MIYQHPLAYLLGLEGVALLRAWGGDYDREFVQARLAEIRRLLDDATLADHDGVLVRRGDTVAAYRRWAATYDEPRNSLFDSDEPVMHAILDTLPIGTALDAACGTGRYAAYLAGRGHRVIGVDSSPEMLAQARVPGASFVHGDLHRLPLADHAVDVVVSALALVHVPSLAPVLAEFARVLRPGGHLVISDVHHELVLLGSVVHALGPADEPGLTPTYRHTPVTTFGQPCRPGCRCGVARNLGLPCRTKRRRHRRNSTSATGLTGPGRYCRWFPQRPWPRSTSRPRSSGTSNSSTPERGPHRLGREVDYTLKRNSTTSPSAIT